MFYMVSQKELDENGAELITKATPWFFTFIVAEFIVGKLRGHRTYRLNDGMASLSQGMVSEQTKLWGRSAFLVLYQETYAQYGLRLFNDPQSFEAFLFGMIAVDFFYYWFHRFSHEFHFAFSQHSGHHTGEDYNLATALRQGALQWLLGMAFTLPLAVFIPPVSLFAHFFANTVAQFWFHTCQIGSLGPLEYILNTPSHHRMHHRPPGNCNVSQKVCLCVGLTLTLSSTAES